MRVLYEEGLASHLGPESCACIGDGACEALTGGTASRVIEPRKAYGTGCLRCRLERGATLARPLEVRACRTLRGRRARRAFKPFARKPGGPGAGRAGMAVRSAERTLRGQGDDERFREVGQPHSTEECFEQRWWCATAGGGAGGKGADRGEFGPANQAPDAGTGKPATRAGPDTAGCAPGQVPRPTPARHYPR